MKGGPERPEVREVPRHKKNPDIGTKKTVYSSTILIEQEDARTFAENEEVQPRFIYTFPLFRLERVFRFARLGKE